MNPTRLRARRQAPRARPIAATACAAAKDPT